MLTVHQVVKSCVHSARSSGGVSAASMLRRGQVGKLGRVKVSPLNNSSDSVHGPNPSPLAARLKLVGDLLHKSRARSGRDRACQVDQKV
jgi:hypothetical protein